MTACKANVSWQLAVVKEDQMVCLEQCNCHAIIFWGNEVTPRIVY